MDTPQFELGDIIEMDKEAKKFKWCRCDGTLLANLEFKVIQRYFHKKYTGFYYRVLPSDNKCIATGGFKDESCTHILPDLSTSDWVLFDSLEGQYLRRTGLVAGRYLSPLNEKGSPVKLDSSGSFCSCPTPHLITSYSGLSGSAESFLFCRICKKERR